METVTDTRRHKMTVMAALAVLILSAFTVVSLASDQSEAEGTTGSWTSGDCTVTLDADGLLTVSGEGAMANYTYGGAVPWSGYKVKEVFVAYGVTSIGNYSFYGQTSLVSVTFETVHLYDSVKSVGRSAFEGCTALKDLNISVRGLETIDNRAFYGCVSLEGFYMPYTVRSINAEAFRGCSTLTSMEFRDNLGGTLGAYSFADTGIAHVTFIDCSPIDGGTVFDGNYREMLYLKHFKQHTYVKKGTVWEQKLNARGVYMPAEEDTGYEYKDNDEYVLPAAAVIAVLAVAWAGILHLYWWKGRK